MGKWEKKDKWVVNYSLVVVVAQYKKWSVILVHCQWVGESNTYPGESSPKGRCIRRRGHWRHLQLCLPPSPVIHSVPKSVIVQCRSDYTTHWLRIFQGLPNVLIRYNLWGLSGILATLSNPMPFHSHFPPSQVSAISVKIYSCLRALNFLFPCVSRPLPLHLLLSGSDTSLGLHSLITFSEKHPSFISLCSFLLSQLLI